MARSETSVAPAAADLADDGEILDSPVLHRGVGLADAAGEGQSQVGSIMRDQQLLSLEAVGACGRAQWLSVDAAAVAPGVVLSVDVELDLVSRVPCADVADAHPNQQLVVVARDADEGLLKVVASHILTRESVLVAGLGGRFAGGVSAQIGSTVSELIKSHLMLALGLTDSARVSLQEKQVLCACPAIIFS